MSFPADAGILTEHRLTKIEIAVDELKSSHGERLKKLEDEAHTREETVWKAMRGLLLLVAGALADQSLNGGALIKALIGALK